MCAFVFTVFKCIIHNFHRFLLIKFCCAFSHFFQIQNSISAFQFRFPSTFFFLFLQICFLFTLAFHFFFYPFLLYSTNLSPPRHGLSLFIFAFHIVTRRKHSLHKRMNLVSKIIDAMLRDALNNVGHIKLFICTRLWR